MAQQSEKSLMTQAAELAETVLPAIESAYESAKEAAGPLLEEAKVTVAPLIADGKELAAEKAASAKALAAEAAAAAQEKAASGSAVEESKGGGWKKWVFLGALLAAGAVIYKKLRGDDTADNWQSSYVPTPAPTPVPDPTPAAETAADSDAETDDSGGAAPDEALADAADEPVAPTTPDAPAEVVDIEADKK